MTITEYSTALETATEIDYLFGYNDEVNQNRDFPLLRVYPFNWLLTRNSQSTFEQKIFIYVKNSSRLTAWDTAIGYFETLKTNLTGSVKILGDTPILLHDFGMVIQEVRVIEITVNITLYC